ncbi:MAG: helix-turn-helix transcriptional regulator, partial [Bacteroidetes bacterium]|nr:helix-turn-helix transcriptional regulator [Bacteroidota bacterium]
AATLAEKIEVQRSSISHILSGRNKPSLDFVMKILKAFPEVELYWLLNGVGDFPNEIKKNVIPSPPSKVNENNAILKKAPISPLEITNNQEIERIVVFFKDGSFKNYNP